MRILYLSPNTGTSTHRLNALRRLGHDVCLVDPRKWVPQDYLVQVWVHRTGAFGISSLIAPPILDAARKFKPDVIWVGHGNLLGPSLLRKLRTTGAKIVDYINDDPFRRGTEWMRFRLFRNSISYYDLIAALRQQNVEEMRSIGARNVLRVWMSADEIVHAPRALPVDVRTAMASDVSFIGTWMPERGPFIAELIERGVPISIWGARWRKAKEWRIIAPHWRGDNLQDPDYANAILASRICLGLLSKGNRDLHTRRSMEIPSLGSVLCAERTSEHQFLYREGIEAEFWSSAAECAQKCLALLNDEPRRTALAENGRKRALKNGNFNERIMAQILSEVMRSA